MAKKAVAKVKRVIASRDFSTPEEEWEAYKAFAEELGLTPTDEDKAKFMKRLEEEKKTSA